MAEAVTFYYVPYLNPFVVAEKRTFCDYVIVGPRDYDACDGGVDEVAAFPVTDAAFYACWSNLKRAGAYVAFIEDDDAPVGGKDTSEHKAWLEGFCEGAAYLRKKCAEWQAMREDKEAAALESKMTANN